jgi:hypothetical protein
MGSLTIKSFLIVSYDKNWKLLNNLQINTVEGQIDLVA